MAYFLCCHFDKPLGFSPVLLMNNYLALSFSSYVYRQRERALKSFVIAIDLSSSSPLHWQSKEIIATCTN